MSSNHIAYISNYNKSKYKMYQFRVKKSDNELINKLDNIPNRNNYITSLILEDIGSSVLTIKQIKERIRPIMAKHKVEDVYLFGSYARGEANSNSDVDLYCSSGDIKNLYDEVSFTDELETALGKKVDVVFIGSQMHDYFRQQLEEDMIELCLGQKKKA